MNVLMFHSIGMQDSNIVHSFLSFPVIHFEYLCKYISAKNIKTSFLDEWHYNKINNLRDNNLYLTFDDGFLDNWVYVFPIAKKYGIKFTIFVNPEFVQEGKVLRAQFNGIDSKELNKFAIGYLNWKELSEMLQSGLVDIQSHSMSHTWYLTNNEVVDVFNPFNYMDYPWIIWDSPNIKKAYYLDCRDLNEFYGLPIFSNGRSLGIRKYIYDNEELNKINEYCKNLYIHKQDINNIIKGTNEYIYNNKLYGRMESDNEMIDRYYYELSESKRFLESELNKSIDYLCWPGGAYNNISVRIARDVGYKASTLASKGDPYPLEFKKHIRIRRFGLSSFWFEFKGKKYYASGISIGSLKYKLKGKRPLKNYLYSGIKRIIAILSNLCL
jgi:peptidoglycan/xylan/chitin deacetylase (PgdA/CDA1 family)